jgi:Pex2 / Pex12 amino terminal region
MAAADSWDESADAPCSPKRVAMQPAAPAASQARARVPESQASAGRTGLARAVSPTDSVSSAVVVAHADTLYVTPRRSLDPDLAHAAASSSASATEAASNGNGNGNGNDRMSLDSDVSWFPVSPPPGRVARPSSRPTGMCAAAGTWAQRWSCCCRVCSALCAVAAAPAVWLVRCVCRGAQTAWRRRWRALAAVAAWAPWLGQLHLAAFYIFGTFLELPKRLTGARMLFIGSSDAHRKYYGAMGVLLMLQLAARAVAHLRCASQPRLGLLTPTSSGMCAGSQHLLSCV